MPNDPASPSTSAGYEKSDATARPLLTFAAVLAGVIAVVAIVMAATFRHFAQSQSLGQPAAPFAAGRLLPPEPRLQPDPRVDLYRLRQQEDATLSSYDWVNPTAGVIRIPVERAMDRLMEKGFPLEQVEQQEKAGKK
jgi:hypothetical protein